MPHLSLWFFNTLLIISTGADCLRLLNNDYLKENVYTKCKSVAIAKLCLY